jgi:hypothetical protein
VLAPLGEPCPGAGAGACEAEGGAGRLDALATPLELVRFIPGVIIGGLGTEVPLGRFWPCPVNDGRMTVGFSPVVLAGG